MKSKIKHKPKKNVHKYPKDDLAISILFTKSLYKEVSDIIKGIVLFGSAARNPSRTTGDIDILVIVDDIGLELTKELMEAYRIVSAKLIAKVNPRIHLTTLRFSTFWDYARNGDPVAINILRDGVSLMDVGFFEPLQALLIKGMIKPSYESMWSYMNRSTENLQNSRAKIIDSVVDLYWVVIDSAHAALMKHGEIPPSPEHVALALSKVLVPAKLCTRTHVNIMDNFYKLYKEITHNKIEDISGIDFEKYYGQAKIFSEKMRSIIEHL